VTVRGWREDPDSRIGTGGSRRGTHSYPGLGFGEYGAAGPSTFNSISGGRRRLWRGQQTRGEGGSGVLSSNGRR